MIRKILAIGALAMSLAFAAGVVAAAPPTDACFLDPPTVATDMILAPDIAAPACAIGNAEPIAAIPKPALIRPVVQRGTCPVMPASTPKMPRLHFDPGRAIA